jgi:hypothetical protein
MQTSRHCTYVYVHAQVYVLDNSDILYSSVQVSCHMCCTQRLCFLHAHACFKYFWLKALQTLETVHNPAQSCLHGCVHAAAAATVVTTVNNRTSIGH